MQTTTRVPAQLSPAPLLLVLLAACGGGGGGGGGELVPTAAVGFPSSGAQTDGDSIAVSGRTTPGAAPVARVRVNGVEATTTDGWATWTAPDVPLARGVNTLRVELEDVDGNLFDLAQLSVRRGELLSELRSLHADPVREIGWITDLGKDALFAMNLVDGELQLVSSDERGTGAPFGYPIDAVPASPDRVYVLDGTYDSIHEVDVATGDRRLLSLSGDPFFLGVLASGMVLDPVSGLLVVAAYDGVFLVDPAQETSKLLVDAPDFDNRPQNIAIDATTGAVYVQYFDRIDRLDTASGQRTTISDEVGIGKGDEFRAPRALSVDPLTGEIWVLNVFPGSILVVDPATGVRRAVVAMKEGGSFSDLAFDPVNRRVLFSERSRDLVYALDPVTEQVDELIGGVGDGEKIARLTHIEIREGRCFGLDASTRSIVTFDGENGNRERIFDASVHAEDEVEDPIAFTLDLENGRALVADAFYEQILTIDLETAQLGTLASAGVQDGFSVADELELLPDGKVLVMDDDEKGLFTIDPETLDQRVISRNGDGRGPDFTSMQHLAITPDGKRAFVTEFNGSDRATVKEIDLETGERSEPIVSFTSKPLSGITLDAQGRELYFAVEETKKIFVYDIVAFTLRTVASSTVGQGPALDSLGVLELDEEHQRLLTWSNKHSAVVAVSLASGDRAILSR